MALSSTLIHSFGVFVSVVGAAALWYDVKKYYAALK